MELVAIVLYVIIGICSAIYLFFKYKFSYWRRHGVPYIEAEIPFGNIKGIGKSIHSSQIMHKYYKERKSDKPFVGIYFFTNPVALITDLDLLRNIFIKDFQYFQDRGLYYNEEDDPLSAHLFSLDGQKWKPLRAKLTPTFTSGRMKYMFPTIVEVSERFQKILKKEIEIEPDMEIKDILARFTTDVIGSCAFGIECNSLQDPNAEFRLKGKKVFTVPKNVAMKQLFMVIFRGLSKKLHFKTHHTDVTDFFMRIVRETIDYRKENNIKRKDFMDLLIELMNTGSLDGSNVGSLSFNEIAAQAFVFFLAGFETSSTTMSYCLYELALNQDIQDKARQVINDVLEEHNGELTYEASLEMTYIDQIINESLRKYPPGANIVRRTTSKYKVPDTKWIFEKGTMIWVPVYAIHHDPEYYPNPEKFDPERFSQSNIHTRHPMAFLPFGEGPRNCIGLRFGMMQVRVGLITLLRKFKFSTCSKTDIPLKFTPKSIVLCPVGGMFLNIESIQN